MTNGNCLEVLCVNCKMCNPGLGLRALDWIRIVVHSLSISVQCEKPIQHARLKGQGKDELAEVWERLLTFAQDPGNDDEGVLAYIWHGPRVT